MNRLKNNDDISHSKWNCQYHIVFTEKRSKFFLQRIWHNYYIIKRWYVVVNRKQRRELRKDKNLTRNLYAIILKYFPELFNKFYNLTDTRNSSYVTYDMKVLSLIRLFGILCGLTSLSTISDDSFNTDACIENISTICQTKLNELPYWETIQDVFVHIKIDELREIQKYIVKALIRLKCLISMNMKVLFNLFLTELVYLIMIII